MQAVNKKEICNENDIKLLVDTFYDKVNQDELLAPVFNDYAGVNWSSHLPVMYNFWASILLGTTNYSGRPFPKHVGLPINEKHFSRWLKLFRETIDELFIGDKAQEAKDRARSIAYIFQKKMGIIAPIDIK